MSLRKIVVQRRGGADADLEIERLRADFPEVELLVADDIDSVAPLIHEAEGLIGMLTAESFKAAANSAGFRPTAPEWTGW